MAVADDNDEWRPRKRIEACASALSPARQHVLRLRTLLSERSHDFFETAKKAKRLSLFVDLISPLLDEYKQALMLERNEQKMKQNDSKTRAPKSGFEFMATVHYYLMRLQCELHRAKRGFCRTRKNALILPPSSAGSIGDDAMVTSTVNTLRKQGFQKIAFLLSAK